MQNDVIKLREALEAVDEDLTKYFRGSADNGDLVLLRDVVREALADSVTEEVELERIKHIVTTHKRSPDIPEVGRAINATQQNVLLAAAEALDDLGAPLNANDIRMILESSPALPAAMTEETVAMDAEAKHIGYAIVPLNGSEVEWFFPLSEKFEAEEMLKDVYPEGEALLIKLCVTQYPAPSQAAAMPVPKIATEIRPLVRQAIALLRLRPMMPDMVSVAEELQTALDGGEVPASPEPNTEWLHAASVAAAMPTAVRSGEKPHFPETIYLFYIPGHECATWTTDATNEKVSAKYVCVGVNKS